MIPYPTWEVEYNKYEYPRIPDQTRIGHNASMCNSVINRHGSFQEVNVHVKKDTFKGRVDFKNTLRQFNPKDDERSRLKK